MPRTFLDKDDTWELDHSKPNSPPKYLYTTVFWEDETHFYWMNQSATRVDLSLLDKFVPTSSILKSDLLPAVPSDLVPLKLPLPDDSYVKRVPPSTAARHEDPAMLAQAIEGELRLWEDVLKHRPHPNLCEYRGFISEDGEHVTGIVFKDHGKTLGSLVKEGVKVDQEGVLKGLRSGVDHLHSFGYIHNDINPENICVADGHPVLIDFDSTFPEGHTYVTGEKRGTHLFSTHDFECQKENDEYSLQCVDEFLRKVLL